MGQPPPHKQVLSKDFASQLMANLGLLYQTKCERTGVPDDIDNAIRCCEQVIDIIGPEDPSADAVLLTLANTHIERYKHNGSSESLAQAVGYVKTLLKSGLPFPEYYLDGGEIMRTSYIATTSNEDLHQSIEWLEQAVSLLPPHHALRPYALYQFGHSLELAYTANQTDDAMARCLNAYKSAAEPSHGYRLIDLQTARRRLYKFLLATDKTHEALPYLEFLVSQMAVQCPRWLSAGDRQYFLSQQQGVSEDAAATLLHLSHSNGYQALRSLELSRGVFFASTIDIRSESKQLALASPELAKDWYRLCMEMDPLLQKNSGDDSSKRQNEAGKKLAETVGLIRQLRGFEGFSPPLDIGSIEAIGLRVASQELFTRYCVLQREYDALVPEKKSGYQTREKRELSHKMDQLLERIRTTPGLEEFLLPQKEASLLELAAGGPIVVINNSAVLDRSDAIIIQSSGIQVLPLPLLRHSDIAMWGFEQRDILTGWKMRNFALKNRRMQDLLLWLWGSAVKPILDRLNIKATTSGIPVHRVHWIPTGALSTLPFHAAGDHTEGSTDNTISYVVSSYIPTLRALSFAREKFSTKEVQGLKPNNYLLIVTVPEAPGMARLPGVEREAEGIARISKPHTKISHLESPGPTSVLQELPLANIVHFACHAIHTPSDLSSSHLVLMPDAMEMNDQAPQTELQPLTLQRISTKKAPSAELAFLSVCSAAENSLSLGDEAIHLASAFQLAGFRHVVGTLWQAKDLCCKEVAQKFYEELWRFHSRVNAGNLRIPHALDYAVREVRKQNSERVLEWGCFVHIGA
jgi:hypothetical protein